jgi:hypothetical protein
LDFIVVQPGSASKSAKCHPQRSALEP